VGDGVVVMQSKEIVNMEYVVVECADTEELSTVVTRHLREGWSLAGGLVILPLTLSYPFLQPMLRAVSDE
jgi:hypothetical protein